MAEHKEQCNLCSADLSSSVLSLQKNHISCYRKGFRLHLSFSGLVSKCGKKKNKKGKKEKKNGTRELRVARLSAVSSGVRWLRAHLGSARLSSGEHQAASLSSHQLCHREGAAAEGCLWMDGSHSVPVALLQGSAPSQVKHAVFASPSLCILNQRRGAATLCIRFLS